MERELTELEGSVLGIIATKGPCTPYSVRKEFQKSPSPFWSGSAGTIYPLMDRLARRKFIKRVKITDDNRGANLYVLTKPGKNALKKWLYQPTSPLVIGLPPDPLRNRISVLGFLSPKGKRSFLNQVIVELEKQAQIFACNCEDSKKTDLFNYLSLKGALLNVKARLAWIREAAKMLETKTIRS